MAQQNKECPTVSRAVRSLTCVKIELVKLQSFNQLAS